MVLDDYTSAIVDEDDTEVDDDGPKMTPTGEDDDEDDADDLDADDLGKAGFGIVGDDDDGSEKPVPDDDDEEDDLISDYFGSESY